MCRRCGGRGCGQCLGGGMLKRDCGLYPGPGVNPLGKSCKECFTKPKSCSGPPYGCPNVNYYPCGFGGKSYGCRDKEPWEIKHLNYVWNYKPPCSNNNGGNGGGGMNLGYSAKGQANVPTFDPTKLPPGCPPPHPLFPRLHNDAGSGPGDGTQISTEMSHKQEPSSDLDKFNAALRQQNEGPDPCLGKTGYSNMTSDECETEEEEDYENCEDEPVTSADVSKYMDKIQTFIMTEVRGDDKHTVQCIRDLVNLRINVLGTASSIPGNDGPQQQRSFPKGTPGNNKALDKEPKTPKTNITQEESTEDDIDEDAGNKEHFL